MIDTPDRNKPAYTQAPPASNWTLIRWMMGLALRHPWRCLYLLVLNLILLVAALTAVTLVGLEIDALRFAVFKQKQPQAAAINQPAAANQPQLSQAVPSSATPGAAPVSVNANPTLTSHAPAVPATTQPRVSARGTPETAIAPPYPQVRGRQLPESWMNQPLKLVIGIALCILVLAIFQAAVKVWVAVVQSKLIQVVMIRLRNDVYDKLQRMSFHFFDANQTGTIINRATGDSFHVANFAELALVQIAVLLINLTVNFIYMVNIHMSLTLVCLLCTPPFMLTASILFARIVRPAYRKNRELYDRLVLVLSENIQGQHVVKGFARQQEEIAKFKAANDNVFQQQHWIFKRVARYNCTVHSLTQINLILVLAYGGYLVIHHAADPYPPVTVGKLIIFAALLQRFSNQVVAVADIANTLQISLTAATRVREVLAAPLEITSAPDAVPMKRATGRVTFENVSFAYKPGEPVLRNINLDVQPGQCIAILGATGAGKSTLLSLISRFYDPQEGRVLIDGQDIRRIQLNDLRRNIGLVFQENFLFSNTVAQNIAFGHPDASLAQIKKAAQMAAAHEFIMELPEGYDTIVGEYGSNLSGGQRQRLAIARAILLEPAILILDDATSAIDPETEHEILQAMDNAMQGRTTFVVAHRLSTLRRADRVLVLDKGRIVQAGTHQELIKRDGHYSHVARLQSIDQESRLIIRAMQWERGEVDTPLLEGSGDELWGRKGAAS